jgi:hypothetical protein
MIAYYYQLAVKLNQHNKERVPVVFVYLKKKKNVGAPNYS